MADRAISETQRDDDFVRVTLWRFPPETSTGWHTHELDYLVVPVKGGTLTVEDASGRRGYPMEAGKSYSREKGVEHDIVNETDAEISFVEVEFKRQR